MALSYISSFVDPGRDASPITIDGSLWPLLRVTLGRSVTRKDLEEYLSARAEYLAREEPHVCIIDAREVDMPAACLRQRYTDWLREHEAPLRRWTLGSAYIIQSPAVRMVMSVIRHFAPMTTPFVITATLPPAAAWAAERLQEVGLAHAATRIRAHHAVPAS
jgi:hypothetical protein